ncbi:MAG: hypothetical protein WD847_03310 [Pirellulales bacterium]
MKILFAIAHYYHPTPGGRYGSQSAKPQRRLQALAACISAVHQVLGGRQRILDIARRLAVPANQSLSHQVDVVVATTGDRHLLGQLPVAVDLYRQHATQAEPLLLGFECQAVLRDALGQYDYYCYLEDDLVLHDPWFFQKLAWFDRLAPADCLLQPCRYEMPAYVVAHKLYVDGDLAPHVAGRFRRQPAPGDVEGETLGASVQFSPALNPHSGCYFLNDRQMRQWASQPHFLDRDTSFVGPLESAATLGILKTFHVYKPVAGQAGFLEIEHFGTQFLSLVGNQVRLAD